MTIKDFFFPATEVPEDAVKSIFSNSILVIPSVSVGNVPQLTADLLIHSLNLKIVGRLNSQYLYPFAGPRDSASSEAGISTAIEVFSGSNPLCPEKDSKITVIQIRSPILPRCKKLFISNVLTPFIREFDFLETVIMGSSNSALSEVIPAPRYKVFYSDKAPDSDSLSARLAKLSLENSQDIPTVKAPYPATKLPESGITLDALEGISSIQLNSSSGLAKVSASVIFVFEGDNFFDAHELADRVMSLLDWDVKKIKSFLQNGRWVEPYSWKGVYGKGVPIGLEEGLYS